MNRKLFLLLIFQGCFMISSIAQDSIAYKPRHLFGIYSGATDHFIIDESTFPDVDFNGLLVPLYINYRYLGVKTRQTCSFYIDHLVLSSTNSNIANDLNATNTNAILEYSYNRQFLTIPKYRLQFFIGGKVESLLNFREYNNFVYDQSEVMIEQFNSLGINLIIEKRFSKNSDLLSFDLHSPFVTYSLVNNIYNQYVNNISQNIQISNLTKVGFNQLWEIIKNGEFVTYNKLIEIESGISYTKMIRKHIGIEAYYRVHYYSFAQYQRLLFATNFDTQLMFGLIIQK